jgi:hypothetical protein
VESKKLKVETDKNQKPIADLALTLMYLTGWEEKDGTGERYIRAWERLRF